MKQRLALLLALALALSACGPGAKDKDSGEQKAPEVQTEVQAGAEKESPFGPAEETAYPLTVTDGLGQTVTLDEEPDRIVSMAPNVTEILFALGLEDAIVGVSEFSDYPEAALEIESIGGANGYDLEKIAGLEPDLVITNAQVEGLAETMAPLEIAVAGYYPQSYNETMDQILQIGVMTNRQEKALEVVTEMEARRAAVLKSVEGLEKPTVLYEIWGDPLMVAGKGSFISELITMAGGIDVAGEAPPYSNFSLEDLVAADPDIYIYGNVDPSLTAEVIGQRPGYGDLKAVQNDQVLAIDVDIISRPGPRLADGLEAVADLIQPDRVK